MMLLDALFFLLLFSVVLTILGVGLILNPKHYLELMKESYRHHFFIYVTGLISVISGIILMRLFSAFDTHMSIAFFTIGFLVAAKGVFFIVYPKGIAIQNQKSMNSVASIRFLGALSVAGGIILGALYFFYLS